jgi:hypothetical protein
VCATAAFSFGCNNPSGDFVNNRVVQACNQDWPACNVVAGCLLGDTNYMQGNFPGDTRVVIQLQAPSSVSVNLYVSQVESAGTYSSFTWFEGGCRARTDVNATGLQMVQESQEQGVFTRQNNLQDVGDHLIEFSSDAQAGYDFSVTVTPLDNTIP